MVVGWFGGTDVAVVAALVAGIVVPARGVIEDVAAAEEKVVRLLHLGLLLLHNQVAAGVGDVGFAADAFSSSLVVVTALIVAAKRSSVIAVAGVW